MNHRISKYEVENDGDFWLDENGSALGDVSIGVEASVSRTWRTGKDEMPYVTLTITYGVEARETDESGAFTDEGPLDYDDWKAKCEAGDTMEYEVVARLDWTVHEDPEDVGGTELASEIDYGEGGVHSMSFHDLVGANAAATAEARSMASFRDVYPENLEVLK